MTHLPLIAVIEDEVPIVKFLHASLISEGYAIVEARTASEGIRLVTQKKPDLVILDLGLPDRDGIEVVKTVREWSTTPIIILSARDNESEKINALDNGANDYLTKPFGVGELLARVRVLLRASATISNTTDTNNTELKFGELCLDLLTRRVHVGDIEVKLTKIEFGLLRTLTKNADRVLTHQYLLREVWGPNAIHEHHYVRIFIANLRKKIEQDPLRPKWIVTEQGVGYRFSSNSSH
ncbi:MAG: response regulator [bacterium]|nr:response regulator [bacterium]